MRGEKRFFSPLIGPVRWAICGAGDEEAETGGESCHVDGGRSVRSGIGSGDVDDWRSATHSK
jgi:hypothetical protein